MPSSEVAAVIDAWWSRAASDTAVSFTKTVVAECDPPTPTRARALLFAVAKLAVFAESVGLELAVDVVCHPSVIERACAGLAMSAPTRRTVRSNLRAVASSVLGSSGAPPLPRERAKTPYSGAEIAAYLALADAQPTAARAVRASALICLGAGAGLMGTDLRAVTGEDVTTIAGAVVVAVSGRRRRMVPVRPGLAERTLDAARFAGPGLLLGGTDVARHNVTSRLTASLAGGSDLPRIELGRLRATWLVAMAEAIGLKAFMDAAGITCSQRLGDLVAHLPPVEEDRVIELLGGRC